MNKTDLVDHVANEAGLSKSDASNAVDAMFGGIVSSLKKGDSATFVGFGTFSVVHREAREGRNPRTGGTIQIAASNQPKFKAGKSFKDAVN